MGGIRLCQACVRQGPDGWSGATRQSRALTSPLIDPTVGGPSQSPPVNLRGREGRLPEFRAEVGGAPRAGRKKWEKRRSRKNRKWKQGSAETRLALWAAAVASLWTHAYFNAVVGKACYLHHLTLVTRTKGSWVIAHIALIKPPFHELLPQSNVPWEEKKNSLPRQTVAHFTVIPSVAFRWTAG